MQSHFLAAINQLCDERGIPRDTILETVKAAIRAAYRKDYGNKDQVIEVEMGGKSEQATVYLVKEVVKRLKIQKRK